MKRYLYIFIIMGLTTCGGPEPRRPVKVNTGSFIKESVERNKQLLVEEEKQIQAIIKKDTLQTYQSTANGSWYYYDSKAGTIGYTPQPDDLVTLTYNIVSFENDTIYSAADIGTIIYKVDKQELFPGLRNSIKLLQEKETATFLFPSSLAYGYHGDNGKIGPNLALKATISILKIEKQQDSIQN